jgi:hypothetical protein
MAETCQMKTQTLAELREGPLSVEVTGSPVLCIEPGGDANLAPFTATARISNAGSNPITLIYYKSATPAFRAVGLWDGTERKKAVFFQDPPRSAASTELVEKTLNSGEGVLISSWTMHHSAIWNALRQNKSIDGGASGHDRNQKRDITVQFKLTVSYATGAKAPAAITKDIAIGFTAVNTDPS